MFHLFLYKQGVLKTSAIRMETLNKKEVTLYE
jgi:hypothetical protein